jgi:hypothetical protein
MNDLEIIMETEGNKIRFYSVLAGKPNQSVLLYEFGRPPDEHTKLTPHVFQALLRGLNGVKFEYVSETQMKTLKKMNEHLDKEV